MSKLLNSRGEPIEKSNNKTQLPSMEQILKDPITKKFVFLESKDVPDQTCIGLTDKTPHSFGSPIDLNSSFDKDLVILAVKVSGKL